MLRTCGCLFLLCGLSLPDAHARDSQEQTLEIVRVGHMAAIQSIRSLSCQIQIDEGQSGTELHRVVSGQYLRVGGIVRIRETYPDGQREDVRVGKDCILSLGTANLPKNGALRSAVREPLNEIVGRCDVWARMLLSLPGRQTSRVEDVGEFVHMPHKRLEAKRVRYEGHELPYLDLIHDDPDLGETRIECWFDPDVNYLVRRMRRTGRGNQADFSIEAFTEASPGIFVPTRSKVEATRNGKRVGVMVTTLTNVKVNEPIAPARMELKIPAGTSMTDRIKGSSYTVDHRGNPMGGSRALASNRMPAFDPGLAESLRTQSDSEAASWFPYLFTVAAAIALFGLVLGIIRKHRLSRA